MAEQLNANNTKPRLIGGRGAAAPRPNARRNEDVFVANVGEKRYLWTARAFAIIMAISLCCNVVLVLAIMQVMPLYRVEPFLLTFQDKQEQIYTANSRQYGGSKGDYRGFCAAICIVAQLL